MNHFLRSKVIYLLILIHIAKSNGDFNRTNESGEENKSPFMPPLKKGQLRLYSNLFCPYSYRVRLILNAKNISHEIIDLSLKSKPEWYAKQVNEENKLPCLQLRDNDNHTRVLTESLIISEYLDESNKMNLIRMTDPFNYALEKLVIEKFSQKVAPYISKLINNSTNTNDSNVFDENVEKFFDKYLIHFKDKRNSNGKTPAYLMGKSRIGFADYMIWPWIERFFYLIEKFDMKFNDNLIKYMGEMLKNDTIKKLHINVEKYEEFFARKQ
jgi:glutathione S-transferase